MEIAVICTALLGLLVFGLGLAVSVNRGAMKLNYGYPPDPTNRLHKIVRAHGNAIEYAPMLAVLILLVGYAEPATWMVVAMIGATFSRYLHATGMILCRNLEDVYPPRALGTFGTYVFGLALVAAVFLV